MTREVVYNACFGGFGLSEEASKLYIKKKYGREAKVGSDRGLWGRSVYIEKPHDFYGRDLERHDPVLVEVVKELGSEKASGFCADLQIETVDGPYRIDEYDGNETVQEPDTLDWVY